MKRLAILFLLITTITYSASISGKISVYTGENYGVFVFIDKIMKYDVTDSSGNFKINGLESGREYTVVFQKENLPEVRRVIKISGENSSIEVAIKKLSEKQGIKTEQKSSRKTVKRRDKVENNSGVIRGRVVSQSNGDIFLRVKEINYGIIIKPNSEFAIKVLKGRYGIELYQDGIKKREIVVNVQNSKNNLGDILLKAEEKQFVDLKISFDKEIEGVVYLYLNGTAKYAERADRKEEVVFKNIEKGDYTIKIVSYGNREYEKKVEIKSDSVEKTEITAAKEEGRLYVYFYPDTIPIELEILKSGSIIKKVEGVQGLYIAEGLNSGEEYTVRAVSKKYIPQELRAVKTGEKVSIALEREIKGALVTGTIYPFSAEAEIMLLDEDKILAKANSDKNGYYELECNEITSGRKIIRVTAKGYKETKEIRTVNEKKETKNVNIALTPVTSNIFGKVNLAGGKSPKNIVVIIEELNLWQVTDETGGYYFANIPGGKYTVSFRKQGYKEIKKEIEFNKNSIKEINVEMSSVGRVIINSNMKEYKLKINESEEEVNSVVYTKELQTGKIYISASKEGYLNEKKEVEISEPGQIAEVNITFRNAKEYKEYLETKLAEIRELVDGLYVYQAERKMEEFIKLEGAESYKFEIDELRRRMNQAKGNLFDADREILAKMEGMKKDIETIERQNIGYGEKRKKLGEKYRESLDILEKIVAEQKYTTFKYEIYLMKSEIYEKMGMPNSAKESMETALKYRAEQQKKR